MDSPFDLMVLDDDGQVIVEDGSLFVNKSELESILVLQLVGLEVAKDGGCWEVIGQPKAVETHATVFYTKNKSENLKMDDN